MSDFPPPKEGVSGASCFADTDGLKSLTPEKQRVKNQGRLRTAVLVQSPQHAKTMIPKPTKGGAGSGGLLSSLTCQSKGSQYPPLGVHILAGEPLLSIVKIVKLYFL